MVCVGVIASPHGIKGEVKIKPFTESVTSFANFTVFYSEDGSTTYKLQITGYSKSMIIAAIDGIDDRNSAQMLRGTYLYVSRGDLETITDDDEFYYTDLIGMQVVTADGSDFGAIYHVHNYGAGDILEIELTNGQKELFVFNKETFPKIDFDCGRITICPPDVV